MNRCVRGLHSLIQLCLSLLVISAVPPLAVQLQDSKPCAEGVVVVAEQPDAPARLSIRKSDCGQTSSSVELLLENLSIIAINGYGISHKQDYEYKKNVETSQISTGGEVKPGETTEIRFSGGFPDGVSYGNPVGSLVRDTYKILWIRFSDGSEWGETPKALREEHRGNDLV